MSLIKSAEMRAVFDWILGLSLTRSMTLWANDNNVDIANDAKSKVLALGRIIIPVCAMVYDREMERTKFSKRIYYPLLAQFQQGDTRNFGYLKSEKSFDKAVIENIITQRLIPLHLFFLEHFPQ